jgi:L-Ala-D/L-Glu epimerase / N-acetyl-D-glutamate racemase
MPSVERFELFRLDLPFRKPFKHAAAERAASSSLYLKCTTNFGAVGFGEALPREYVTGETLDGAFQLLQQKILPRLVGMEFASLEEVKAFLLRCDGKAPQEWVASDRPQAAAWCAVDLCLLDAFGRQFDEPIRLDGDRTVPGNFRYSPVISADSGPAYWKTLLKVRLFGFRQVKVKVENDSVSAVRLARRVLGKRCDIRVDANMAWSIREAEEQMQRLARFGVRIVEQPVAADATDGLAQLVRQTGLGVMVDESLTDRQSLEQLIRKKACTAVNVRVSKCGGLMASLMRCREALAAGMTLQIGCQVGETSLLSAAQLVLLAAVRKVTYGEGCFGLLLLQTDPAHPLLQFGYGGHPPGLPDGPGFGMGIDEMALERWSTRQSSVSDDARN